MTQWNSQFTQMVRNSHPGYWGNWGLSPDIAPGAVGIVDPHNGSFRRIAAALPGLDDAQLRRQPLSIDWSMMTSDVRQTRAAAQLDGSVTDPETGLKITAGTKITWSFGRQGSMVSQCALEETVGLNDPTALLTRHLDWLLARAQEAGMQQGNGIAQGFGVITDVLYARSGVNVASQSADNSFSITGNAGAVEKMLGQARGRGSFVSTSAQRSVDLHLWPSEAGRLADTQAPLAFAFASFGGRLPMPNWITHLGAFTLILRNNHGGTYIVDAHLQFDTPRGAQQRRVTVSGGLTSTIGDIPLDASNLRLELGFRGIRSTDRRHFHWQRPLGQWLNGVRTIDLFGVWPGQTRAVDVEGRVEAR